MAGKHGYYFSSGVSSYSKMECMKLGRTTFHFNDDVFSAIDTTKEPSESLPYLYRERARQIRNQYDYVVLMYSGGSDSENVLESFLEADCKIDEICTCWDYPTTGDRNSFHNAEIVRVVVPKMKELEDHGYKIPFRKIDITQLAIEALPKLGLDAEYFINYHLSVNNVAKHFLREHVKEWADMIAAGKKLVLVWGVEKPSLRYHSGKHWLTFSDNVDNCVGPYTMKRGWFDEFFYWTPDMPEIVIKQAHVVAKFCNLVNEPSYYATEDRFSGYNKQLDKYLKYEHIKNLIYPSTWNPFTFCNGKSLSMVYSARDAFFLNGNVNVEHFHSVVDSYFKQLNDGTPKYQRLAVKPLYTREYEIC